VQKHALESVVTHDFIELTISIFVISGNRMTGICRVHTNLMRTARQNRYFHQTRHPTKKLHRTKITDCLFTIFAYAHRPLTA